MKPESRRGDGSAVKIPTAFSEDQRVVPSTHMVTHNFS